MTFSDVLDLAEAAFRQTDLTEYTPKYSTFTTHNVLEKKNICKGVMQLANIMLTMR